MLLKDTATVLTTEETKRLYDLAVQVKTLAPWEWMDETEVFGVQHPDTGGLGFVSVMGMAGEHFAIALYLDAEGLYGFRRLEAAGDEMMPHEVLEIGQLQASFEDREMLDKADRDAMKQLGFKFRGRHAYPMFRSYRPGFMPWYVTAEEAGFLIYALEQTLVVAPRVRDEPEILFAEEDEDAEDEICLVRVPRREGERIEWDDQMMRVPQPTPTCLPVMLDLEVIGRLKQSPRRALSLEIDLLGMPMSIGAKGERPSMPYMLMLADGRTGVIVGFELMKVETTLDEMRAEIPNTLARLLAGTGESGLVPQEIVVRAETLYELLKPLAATLNIKLRQAGSLPSIEMAMNAMGEMMGGGL